MKNLGVLEKINSTHNNLRTNTMQGVFEKFPSIGETFQIFGEGISFGNRMIFTSPIKEIIEAGKDKDDLEYIVFQTANSMYRLTLLEDNVSGDDYLEESFKFPDIKTDIQ